MGVDVDAAFRVCIRQHFLTLGRFEAQGGDMKHESEIVVQGAILIEVLNHTLEKKAIGITVHLLVVCGLTQPLLPRSLRTKRGVWADCVELYVWRRNADPQRTFRRELLIWDWLAELFQFAKIPNTNPRQLARLCPSTETLYVPARIALRFLF